MGFLNTAVGKSISPFVLCVYAFYTKLVYEGMNQCYNSCLSAHLMTARPVSPQSEWLASNVRTSSVIVHTTGVHVTDYTATSYSQRYEAMFLTPVSCRCMSAETRAIEKVELASIWFYSGCFLSF